MFYHFLENFCFVSARGNQAHVFLTNCSRFPEFRLLEQPKKKKCHEVFRVCLCVRACMRACVRACVCEVRHLRFS